jgi:glycosyltransferase involved in cell wall biosynthesis
LLRDKFSVDVEFYGRAEPAIVDELLQESRIFALLSSYEGMSFSLLRAMMFGLPVVVSNISANTDVVTNGFNGIVVDLNNREELKLTILELAQNSKLQTMIGGQARKKAMEDFTLTQVLENTIRNICEEESNRK